MTKINKKQYRNSSKPWLTVTLLVSFFVFSFALILDADLSIIKKSIDAYAANSLQLGTFNPLDNQSSSTPTHPPGLPSPTPTITTFSTVTPVPTVCEPKKLDCWNDFSNCLVCKKLLSNCKIRETKDCPSCGGAH